MVPIRAAPEPRRPRLGRILRLPQTGQCVRRAEPRGVTRVSSVISGVRIARRGKCPGRPTIKRNTPPANATPLGGGGGSRERETMRRTGHSGALFGPLGLVAGRVRWATSLRDRLRGVRGGEPLGPQDALVIWPCRRVHTRGVGYDLDAVFCDRGLVVLHVETLGPGGLSRRVRGARCCVELLGGRARACGLAPGASLEFRDAA